MSAATTSAQAPRLARPGPARAARLFARLMRAVQGLQAWTAGLTPAPFRLVQIGSAYWQSRALGLAAELDVAEQLGEATLPIEALAARCQAAPELLQRLLRVLAALGVFEEPRPGQWRNNKGSAPLRAGRPDSVRELVLLHQRPEMRAAWFDSLGPALRQGRCAYALSHGRPLFEHMERQPALEHAFARAMAQVEGLTGAPWVQALDWQRFEHLIDLGGSVGDKALTLLMQHPRLHATVVDRPATVRAAQLLAAGETEPQRLRARERLRFLAADLRQEPPPAARSATEVYWLSALLHGLSDADALQLLRGVAQAAAPAGATVLVMEVVRPEQHPGLAIAGMDLQMAVCTEGRERSLREWQALFEQAGLSLCERVPLPSLAEILVLRPAT
ncbi:methyltransferase [Paucibacter aquatile]|uniref:Methyltransferase n=1 Tax=Kinneretia aquatilis TaxID=2070761 RepID=A0A2N8KYK1_9BURK|nr:methyltransferase [Paucibacter aquatile]PND38528.1 methyltransferase [Paucibacter aquatile]